MITALTVQSTLGVARVEPVDAGLLRATLEHLHADLPAEGIKIGMLGSQAAVEVVAAFLPRLATPRERSVPVVLDPVLRSSSGAALLSVDALESLRSELLPRVSVVTPNWSELEVLTGRHVTSVAEAASAA